MIFLFGKETASGRVLGQHLDMRGGIWDVQPFTEKPTECFDDGQVGVQCAIEYVPVTEPVQVLMDVVWFELVDSNYRFWKAVNEEPDYHSIMLLCPNGVTLDVTVEFIDDDGQ